MLMKLRKRKKVESYGFQALRDIVKENVEDVVNRFENKFKEIRIEGKRKFSNSTSVYYNQSTKRLKPCTWAQNQKLEKGITHIVKTDLNLEIKDSDLPKEAGANL